jgi:hypothetical protein
VPRAWPWWCVCAAGCWLLAGGCWLALALVWCVVGLSHCHCSVAVAGGWWLVAGGGWCLCAVSNCVLCLCLVCLVAGGWWVVVAEWLVVRLVPRATSRRHVPRRPVPVPACALCAVRGCLGVPGPAASSCAPGWLPGLPVPSRPAPSAQRRATHGGGAAGRTSHLSGLRPRPRRLRPTSASSVISISASSATPSLLPLAPAARPSSSLSSLLLQCSFFLLPSCL